MKLTATQVLDAIEACNDMQKVAETVERMRAEILATKDLTATAYMAEEGYDKKKVKRYAFCFDDQTIIGIAKYGKRWKVVHLPTGLVAAGSGVANWDRAEALRVAKTVLVHANKERLKSSDGAVAVKAFSKELVEWLKNPEGEFLAK